MRSRMKQNADLEKKKLTFTIGRLHSRVLVLQVGLQVFQHLDLQTDQSAFIRQHGVVQHLHILHEHELRVHDELETCGTGLKTYLLVKIKYSVSVTWSDVRWSWTIPRPMMALFWTSSSSCVVKYSSRSNTLSLMTI